MCNETFVLDEQVLWSSAGCNGPLHLFHNNIFVVIVPPLFWVTSAYLVYTQFESLAMFYDSPIQEFHKPPFVVFIVEPLDGVNRLKVIVLYNSLENVSIFGQVDKGKKTFLFNNMRG
jgi:hypothetical protein